MKIRILILIIIFCSGLLFNNYGRATNGGEVRVLSAENSRAGLRDKIRLTVKNLAILNKEAKDKNKKIIPYFDGLPLEDVKTYQPKSETLEFAVRRSQNTKEVWTTLVTQKDKFFTSSITLSVGLEGGEPVPTELTDFTLIIIKRGWFVACSIAIIIILIFFLWLVKDSNIIRDSGPKPKDPYKRPFSIGRTQMAIWFFLVIASYPFLWLITGELGTITGSVLGLMGISAGTALGARIIDLNKNNATISDTINKLKKEKTFIEKRISELEGFIGKSPAPPNLKDLEDELQQKEIRLGEIDQQINEITITGLVRKSDGFFRDVLSDIHGISFHRFQILAWTIVLGIIFIAEVYSNLRMPEFSQTLLALMGISSGTYIGFKFPEQKST
jgi:hypothetical protein